MGFALGEMTGGSAWQQIGTYWWRGISGSSPSTLGEAAADARVVDGEAGRVAGPTGAAGSIDEGDADGGVGEGVGEVGDFHLGCVGHHDPRGWLALLRGTG